MDAVDQDGVTHKLNVWERILTEPEFQNFPRPTACTTEDHKTLVRVSKGNYHVLQHPSQTFTSTDENAP